MNKFELICHKWYATFIKSYHNLTFDYILSCHQSLYFLPHYYSDNFEVVMELFSPIRSKIICYRNLENTHRLFSLLCEAPFKE